ncbi:MAG: hypothetical protein ACYCQJ_01305 [Nitrososphaerales archaeon]
MSADVKAADPKPKDGTALLGKDADEAKGKKDDKPGDVSAGQKVVTLKEFKEEKKEAAGNQEKKVSEGQVEIS